MHGYISFTVILDLVQKNEGYPSGSMVDFACDTDDSPIMAFISSSIHSLKSLGKSSGKSRFRRNAVCISHGIEI